MQEKTVRPLAARLGTRVRLLRKKRGLSQRELAETVGVSPSALSLVEKGLRWPGADTLQGLSQALDTEAEQLLMVPAWFDLCEALDRLPEEDRQLALGLIFRLAGKTEDES